MKIVFYIRFCRVSREIHKYQESIVKAARKGWQGIDTGTDGENNTPW